MKHLCRLLISTQAHRACVVDITLQAFSGNAKYSDVDARGSALGMLVSNPILGFSEADRTSIVSLAKQLFTEHVDGKQKLNIITTLAYVPKAEHLARVSNAKTNINLEPDNPMYFTRLMQILNTRL